MDGITFQCRNFNDTAISQIWYLWSDGRLVIGAYVYETLDGSNYIYRARYNGRMVPGKKKFARLNDAKQALIERFNIAQKGG
jgi:hypothetical protein